VQLVGKQLLVLLNAKATGEKKKTGGEVEPVMAVITWNDATSNASNPLLWSHALAKGDDYRNPRAVQTPTFHRLPKPLLRPLFLSRHLKHMLLQTIL